MHVSGRICLSHSSLGLASHLCPSVLPTRRGGAARFRMRERNTRSGLEGASDGRRHRGKDLWSSYLLCGYGAFYFPFHLLLNCFPLSLVSCLRKYSGTHVDSQQEKTGQYSIIYLFRLCLDEKPVLIKVFSIISCILFSIKVREWEHLKSAGVFQARTLAHNLSCSIIEFCLDIFLDQVMEQVMSSLCTSSFNVLAWGRHAPAV